MGHEKLPAVGGFGVYVGVLLECLCKADEEGGWVFMFFLNDFVKFFKIDCLLGCLAETCY